MAEETRLQIAVSQTPGTVEWNYGQLREAVEKIAGEYTGMVYTDQNITAARKDLAALRKLRTSLESQKAAIKAACLEPYKIIEAQADELSEVINGPIKAIDAQVKAYDRAKHAERRKAVLQFMDAEFSDLPQDAALALKTATYQTRWEANNAVQREWQGVVREAHRKALEDLRQISALDEDVRDTAYAAWLSGGLSLDAAVSRVREYREQEAAFARREAARREAEEQERARREQALREREEEARRREEQARKDQAERERQFEEKRREAMKKLENLKAPAQEKMPPVPEGMIRKVLAVTGTPQQIEKVKAYAKYAGAVCEEVRSWS